MCGSGLWQDWVGCRIFGSGIGSSTPGGVRAAELRAILRGTVEEAAAVIEKLPPERLLVVHEIQGRRVTGLEAIFKVVEHFGQHTGQIILLTKSLTGLDLDLTIPRRR